MSGPDGCEFEHGRLCPVRLIGLKQLDWQFRADEKPLTSPRMKAFRWELPNDHKKTAKTLQTLTAGLFFFFKEMPLFHIILCEACLSEGDSGGVSAKSSCRRCVIVLVLCL